MFLTNDQDPQTKQILSAVLEFKHKFCEVSCTANRKLLQIHHLLNKYLLFVETFSVVDLSIPFEWESGYVLSSFFIPLKRA